MSFRGMIPAMDATGLSSKQGSAWSELPLEPKSPSARLLTLNNCDRDSVVCNLSVHPLNACPPFYALSYCWGASDATHTILCNGYEIPVTTNLYTALRQLYKLHYTVLWVDAVCINQLNIEEKNDQVKLMGKIYETALMTLVWLGPAELLHTRLVECIGDLSRAYEKHHDVFNKAFDNGITIYRKDLATLDLPSWRDDHEPLLEPLSRFFTLPWFNRAWVIQEFTLAKDVNFVYGQTVFHWVELRNAFAALKNLSSYSFYIQERWDRWRNISWLREDSDHGSNGILEPTWYHRSAICKDQRDKVFSLLGIFEKITRNSGHRISVDPNYHVKFEDVYFAFASNLLKGAKTLDMFCFLRPPGRKEIQLPSWVPDFTTARQRFLMLSWWSVKYGFRAAGESTPTVKRQDKILHLQSQLFDRVVETSKYIEDLDALGPQHETLNKCPLAITKIGEVLKSRLKICPRDGTYLTGQTSREAFWQTLFLRTDPDHEAVRQACDTDIWSTLEATIIDAAETIQRNGIEGDQLNIDQLNIKLESMIRKWCIDTSLKMARTSRGYYCLVPWMTEVGDDIVLSAGGRMPFAMHRINEHGGLNYRILGGCYVHGIMFGEAWEPCRLEDALIYQDLLRIPIQAVMVTKVGCGLHATTNPYPAFIIVCWLMVRISEPTGNIQRCDRHFYFQY